MPSIPYQALKYIVFIFLAAYVIGGLATNPYTIFGEQDGKEVYPVFSWFLFAKIPTPQSKYVLRLHSYGTEVYNPPLAFEETSFLFRAIGQTPTRYLQEVSSFGREIEQGRNGEPYRTNLEKIFMKPARYEIVRIHYDSLEYWKTGLTKKEKVLGIFSTEDTP